MIICVLLVAGAAAGLAAYEAVVRTAMPERVEALGAAKTSREDAHRNRAGEAIGALARTLERFAPQTRSDVEACRERLSRAGVILEPETWRSLRAVSTMGCMGLAAAAAMAASLSPAAGICVAAVCAAVGWLAPSLALQRLERRRKRSIEIRLPDAMELLGIAIAAGSPVEQCFREVAASMDGPVAQEFSLVDKEVNLLGHSREEALRHLGQRCNSQDVSAFVAQMIQTISQGSSVSDGLAMQAALAREIAQADTMERIRKMPTKLDIVLSLCFLPPTVALVVVPTVVSLLDFLNNSMG